MKGSAAAAPRREANSRNHRTRQGNLCGCSPGMFSVDPLGIVSHHPVAAEKRHESLYRSLHHRYPTARNVLMVAVVKARHNLFGENPVHRFSFATIRFFRS